MNEELRHYIGSADRRARMAKYGFTRTQIDGVIAARASPL
jgi:polar amino acid transport system substrate-binding protein